MFHLKYIVASNPRSGSQYMSKLFTAAGEPMTHEMCYGMPGNGIYMNSFVGESSWLIAPYLHEYKDSTIIHITRNPLKVISSLLSVGNLCNDQIEKNPYSRYKVDCLPAIRGFAGLDRYLYFYIQWNRTIEKHTDKRYKVEDISEDPVAFFQELGIKYKPVEIPRDTNTWGSVDKYLERADLDQCKLKKEFLQIMQDYNYVDR